MNKMNVIMVFDKDKNNLLMCKREKNPYKGLYNMVGGKIESDDSLSEAYRELYEESGIKESDINLIHFMNMTYHLWNIDLEIYYGVLNNDVELVEELNKLEWLSIEENFFDSTRFAGNGNIGHILECIKREMEE